MSTDNDLAEVIGLLERWRDAGGIGRMQIGVEASRAISAMPAERKRALAIEVAERVAPQLVPAIEAEDGDLTAKQVGAVVDLLRRAERDQLDDLVTALRTGQVDDALVIVDDALDAIAAEQDEADDVAVEQPQEVGPGSPADIVEEAAASVVGDDDEIDVGQDGQLELDEEAVRRRMEQEAAERAKQYRESSPEIPRQPAYRAPAIDFTDRDLDLPDTSVETLAPLRERIADDRRDSVAQSASGQLAAPPVTAQVAAITARADGYRRRRAAMRAIGDERLDADDVAAVVRSFGRGSDKAWIAGAALDAGIVGLGDLEGLGLTTTALERLRRRVG